MPHSLLCLTRWLNPLFTTGYKRSLEEDDMYEVLAEDGSESLGQELNRYRVFHKPSETVTLLHPHFHLMEP